FMEIARVLLPDQTPAVLYKKTKDPARLNLRDNLLEALAEEAEAYGENVYTGSKDAYQIGSEARPVIAQDPGTDLRFPYLYIPDWGAALQFGVGLRGSAPWAECSRTYQVKATEMAAPYKEEVVLSSTIDPARDPVPLWYGGDLSLDRFRGRIINLMVTALPHA